MRGSSTTQGETHAKTTRLCLTSGGIVQNGCDRNVKKVYNRGLLDKN